MMRIQNVSILLVILFCWMYFWDHVCMVSGLCHQDQRSLLLQLKNNLTFNHEMSNKLVSWNQRFPCCQWSGVTCDEEGRVTGLDLSEESISGGFDNSSSLFCLQHLQILNMATNNFNSVIPSGFNKLKNLIYLNLSYAGFVGQIPMEISQLTRLVTLDISSFSYSIEPLLKLGNPNLQKLVHNLTKMEQLCLNGVSITAHGKEWCNALLLLPSLRKLSMSNCNLSGPLDSSLTKLEHLSVIRLDGNNFSAAVPGTFANFKNLTTLSLANCGLTGTFPAGIFQIQTLSDLTVSFNFGLSGSLPDFNANGSLQTLALSNTSFSGALPDAIGNLRQLSILDLSMSQFTGRLPNSISNLRELKYLDLSFNNFSGPIPSFGMSKKLAYIDLSHNDLSGEIQYVHFEELRSLVRVNLGHNSLNGIIPSSLLSLPLLQTILLSYNKFGQLGEFSDVSSSMLDYLDLSSNSIAGNVPAPLFQLKRLVVLNLSSNKFNGSMSLNMLLEHKNLTTLDLSYNNLSVNVNVTGARLSSALSLTNLKLASCNLRAIPDLRQQHGLSYLDLSDNHIQGEVPNWIWKLDYLSNLNLSHNLLTHLEGPLQNLTSNLLVLDLHSNQLEGSIPIPSIFATYLDYSNNKFSSFIPDDIGDYLSLTVFFSLSNNTIQGFIPETICSISFITVLDLSYNNFTGAIPQCLLAMSETLGVLNLRKNMFKGHIPDKFPTSCALQTLDLHGNLLDGPIPKSLANCITLEVLDLGANQIVDGFPCFLTEIPALRVLVLRSNKFRGSVECSKTKGTWNKLQIVDLAFNSFRGKLPRKSFNNWEAMISGEDHAVSGLKQIRFQVFTLDPVYYKNTVTVMSKGLQMNLVKILTIFTSIDFSSNHFEGPLPEELMNFKALHVLNLSNNAFFGQLPSSVGNLRQLESLDLSKNSFSGEIPTQLATLSFLSFLNLSFNHLLGRIPTGTQLQSFEATSFLGNEKLCGSPLTEKCINDGPPPATEVPNSDSGTESSTDWNFVSAESGFVFGLLSVVWPLIFWKPWRSWYWKLVDNILCKIFPPLYLSLEYGRGQWYSTLRWGQ